MVTPKRKTRLDAARAVAAELLGDSAYKDGLRLRLRAGLCAPALETLLYHYLYGKPVEPVEVATRGNDLRDLSDDELSKELAAAAKELAAARREERAKDDDENHETAEHVH